MLKNTHLHTLALIIPGIIVVGSVVIYFKQCYFTTMSTGLNTSHRAVGFLQCVDDNVVNFVSSVLVKVLFAASVS